MNTLRDHDAVIGAWLDDGPQTLPAETRQAITVGMRAVTRRGSRIGWQLPRLRRPTIEPRRLSVALGGAAVLVVAAALALNLYANQRGIGVDQSPTPEATPTVTAPPPPVDLGIFEPVAGRIVYGSGTGIWGFDPAAPDRPRVQVTAEVGTPIGWSSDGARLLLVRDGRLVVLHADGSETQLTTMGVNDATISPDGSRVVFADSGALYSVDADGGPAELLVEPDVPMEGVTFSPDGTRIAYVYGAGDNGHHVWVVDADGTNAHEILANDTTLGAGHVRDHGLAWSPAGDRIALALGGTIYTFAADGSSFTRIAGGDSTCGSAEECSVKLRIYGVAPYWSPDGSQIAYTTGCSDGSFACGLAIVDADGSNARELSYALSGPWHPATPSPSAEPRTAPSLSPSPITGSGGMWPQSTLEEVRAAQELADAGHIQYTWQRPLTLEAHLRQGGPFQELIFARFLEEVLGWEKFQWTLGNGAYEDLPGVFFLRCAPGPTNPLYPDDPNCAPTIDESRYETVRIHVGQPIRQGPSGIWVVTGWEMIEPFERPAPPSEEVTGGS